MPKGSLLKDQFFLLDTPGLKDNRAHLINLVNVTIIKNLINNANSVKLIVLFN